MQCEYVEPNLDETFQYDDGDEILVKEGIATYKGTEYSEGSTFTIEEDTGAFANGLQFTGNVVATRTKRDTFCDKGNSFQDQVRQHDETGWDCEKGKD